MVSSVGIGSSSGLQQTNLLNCNSANNDATNSSASSLLSFLSTPSAGANDPTQSASSTGGSTATQPLDPGLQAFLVQLQAALGSGAAGQPAPAGATDPLGAASAPTGAVDADGDQDGSQAQTGQVTGHHHGHHHHQETSAANGANGPAGTASLQTDVNKLVNDLFSMLQQTGSGASSTATSTSANGSSSDPSNSTVAAASSSSTSIGDPASAPTDPNSLAAIANTLSQDLLNAIQAYSPSNAQQSTPNASASITA